MWPTSPAFTGRPWTNFAPNRPGPRVSPARRATIWKWPFRAASTPAGSPGSTISGWSTARFEKKRGVWPARVRRVEGEKIFARLEAPLKAGDGIVFDAGRPDEKEEGGRVWRVEQARGSEPSLCVLGFARDDLDFNRIHIGDRIWKTSDPELDRRLRQSFAGQAPRFRRPLSLEVHGRASGPMTVIGRDELGHVARVQSSLPLAVAG